AAFFDCDKTLIPGSSLFLMARGLYDRDFVRVRQMFGWAWGQFRFRLSGKEDMEFSGGVSEQALALVAGRHRDELAALGREVAEERILPRVYEDIARQIAEHRERGEETWLLTAAPQELAEAIAVGLGMTGARGTTAEVDDDGVYTGRLTGRMLHAEEKAKAAAALADERDINLLASFAYSDSKNDLPLLELVGRPNAVNPDAELKRIARTRGWPIFELRAKRRALLIGIPSAAGAAGLFAGGFALGSWMKARQMRELMRQRRRWWVR
ncbi:MAG: HAD family hydrolase, partial [Actinomycetota bacterium]